MAPEAGHSNTAPPWQKSQSAPALGRTRTRSPHSRVVAWEIVAVRARHTGCSHSSHGHRHLARSWSRCRRARRSPRRRLRRARRYGHRHGRRLDRRLAVRPRGMALADRRPRRHDLHRVHRRVDLARDPAAVPIRYVQRPPALAEPTVVLGRAERPRIHAIAAHDPVEVIDLVLEDPRVIEATGWYARRAVLVEGLDPDRAKARPHQHEALERQAPYV